MYVGCEGEVLFLKPKNTGMALFAVHGSQQYSVWNDKVTLPLSIYSLPLFLYLFTTVVTSNIQKLS
jgi:hypothetical protein